MIFAKKKHVLRPVILAIVLTMLAWIPAGMQNCWAATGDEVWEDEIVDDDTWEDNETEKDEIWYKVSDDGEEFLYFDRATGTITEIYTVMNSLIIPDKIEGIAVTGIDGYAWNDCSSKTVTLPSTLKSISNMDPEYFNVENIIIQGTPVIESWAFASDGYTNDSLKSVTIPEGVTTIRDGAFISCNFLTSITIPKSVTTIGERAFGYYQYENDGTCYDKYENFTIKGYGTNSAAAKYAEENGFKYVDLGGTAAPVKTKAAPAKVAGLKVKAGKKQMTVSWKKAKNASGYEITYAANKSFKSAAKKVTAKNTANIKKLKSKKTYYVKVRAYNKANGKKQYGKYSSVMRVKVK